MDSNKGKTEKGAVDIFKLACAVMVVAIHTKPFADSFLLDAAVGMCTRFAVPFFFFSSAYFLFAKLQTTEKSAHNAVFGGYFLRLLRFYTVWYVVVALTNALVRGSFNEPLYYLKQFIFSTDGSPLWFVCALMWGSAITFCLRKLFRPRTVLCVSLVMLLVGYAMSTMYALTCTIPCVRWLNDTVISFIGTQNGLFFAFPYAALALVTAEHGGKMNAEKALNAVKVYNTDNVEKSLNADKAYNAEKSLNADKAYNADNSLNADKAYNAEKSHNVEKARRRDLLLAVIFFITLGAEALFAVLVCNAPLTFLWLSAVPMTLFLFRFLYYLELPPRPIYKRLRKVGTLVYVVQIPLLKAVSCLITAVGISDAHNLVYFAATVILSALVSVGLVALSEQKPFRFIKYLM